MTPAYSTGAVAKLIGVPARTVRAWFDAGKLRGYRVPGSQDRRIPRENLIRFLEDNGMPLPEQLQDAPAAIQED